MKVLRILPHRVAQRALRFPFYVLEVSCLAPASLVWYYRLFAFGTKELVIPNLANPFIDLVGMLNGDKALRHSGHTSPILPDAKSRWIPNYDRCIPLRHK